MSKYLIILIITVPLWAWATPAEVISLPEVTINDTRPEEDSLVTSTTESLGERISLEGESSRSLSQVLVASPSVQAMPALTGSAPPTFSLRGMDSTQTLVFVEGIPLTEPVFLSDNLSLIPKLAPQEVDIYSEAVPAAFLANSLGGGIDLHLKERVNRGKVLAQVGNLGLLRVSSQANLLSSVNFDFEYEQAKENFSYLDNQSTPFNSNDDQLKERENNSYRRLSLLPSFRFQNGGSKVHLFSLNSFQTAETPGPINKPESHRLQDWNSLSAVRGTTVLTQSLSGEGVVFFRFREDELQGTRQESSLNTTGGARVSLEWKEPQWRSLFALGINYSKYRFEGASENRRQFSFERVELPASGSLHIALGESFTLKPAYLVTLTDSVWNSSPRLGFEMVPSSAVRVFGFGGAVFRHPSLSELYGNQLGLVSNSSLQSETATKAELGMKWSPVFISSTVKSFLSYSVFGARAKNLITFSQVGPDLQRAENIGMASWLGQELSLGVESASGFFCRPSMTWLWTRNESAIAAEKGKDLPYRFPLSIRWEMGTNRESWGAGYRASFFSASYLDKANQEQLAPYHLHDFYLRLKVKAAGQFELNIQNLFNLTLASAAVTGVEVSKYISGVNGYPTSGRRVGVTWIYDL
jgi:outer membrane cobalamin receptor